MLDEATSSLDVPSERRCRRAGDGARRPHGADHRPPAVDGAHRRPGAGHGGRPDGGGRLARRSCSPTVAASPSSTPPGARACTSPDPSRHSRYGESSFPARRVVVSGTASPGSGHGPTIGAVLPDTAPAPLDVLQRVFGYDAFRGDQQEIIDHVVRRRRRARAHADRRRQVAVLPDPGARPARRRGGRLAADRAHAGPGRRAARARRARRASSTPRRTPTSAATVEARVPRRRARPALPRARAAARERDAAACSTAARSRCSRSTRRTASRSGATTSGPTTSRCPSCTSAGPTCRGSR